MQIVKLFHEGNNFHCPITGECILSKDEYGGSPAIIGIWASECLEDPSELSPKIEEYWTAYYDRKKFFNPNCLDPNFDFGSFKKEVEHRISKNNESPHIDMDEFFKEIEGENLVCFKIEQVSCPPGHCFTMWIAMDLSYSNESE